MLACVLLGTAAQAQPFVKEALTAPFALVDADSTFTDCDWSALVRDVGTRDIVMIGEPDHGAQQVFTVRNSLIAELHAKHGFDVVLFESGMGELLLPDTSTPEEWANGLMGPWNTRASAELMAHLQQQHMAFAGFDVQRNGRSFARVLRKAGAALGLDSALYGSVEERFGAMLKRLGAKADHATVQGETERLIADYVSLYNAMGRSLPATPSVEQRLIRRTLKDRADHLRYMLRFTLDKDWHERWAARDAALADNVRWLLDTVYAGHKAIVVGHNFHVARTCGQERTMGETLHAAYGDRMLVIGTFTGGGSYADNTRNTVLMTTPDPDARDIKHVIGALPGFVHYLSLPDTLGPAWTDQPVVVNDTFIDLANTNTLVPAKQFDALLLIERVSPSVFLDP
jgi:erythromycin esterase